MNDEKLTSKNGGCAPELKVKTAKASNESSRLSFHGFIIDLNSNRSIFTSGWFISIRFEK